MKFTLYSVALIAACSSLGAQAIDIADTYANLAIPTYSSEWAQVEAEPAADGCPELLKAVKKADNDFTKKYEFSFVTAAVDEAMDVIYTVRDEHDTPIIKKFSEVMDLSNCMKELTAIKKRQVVYEKNLAKADKDGYFSEDQFWYDRAIIVLLSK